MARMQKMIESHAGLKTYREINGPNSAARFWNLLRSDLMRLSPDNVASYLRRVDLKLAEAGTLGKDLADEFFSTHSEHELRLSQEALIYACIEMDAAWKVRLSGPEHIKESLSKELKILKENLPRKLKLWGVP